MTSWHAVELGHARDDGFGDEQVPPQEPHGVLHAPLLIARVWVAVPALAAVVRSELGEQLRFGDDAADHPACLGGIVEHHGAGRATDPLEDLAEAAAEALRAFASHRDTEPRVGMREGHDQELHDYCIY